MKPLGIYFWVLGLVGFSMLASGQSLSEYYAPTSLLVLGGSLLASGVCFSRSDWRNLWQAVRGQVSARQICLQALKQLGLMQRLVYVALGLQALMALVSMLADLENMATVGNFLAVLLFNGIYALMLSWLVLLPLQLRLKSLAQSADDGLI